MKPQTLLKKIEFLLSSLPSFETDSSNFELRERGIWRGQAVGAIDQQTQATQALEQIAKQAVIGDILSPTGE